jgi:hypothetical protein
MRINTLNMNAVQMAADNWQLAHGNHHLAAGKSLLASGCLQTSAGRKVLDSRPEIRPKGNGLRVNRPMRSKP